MLGSRPRMARSRAVGSSSGTAPASDPPRQTTDLARALSGLAFAVPTVTVGGERLDGQLARGITGSITLNAISGVYPFRNFAVGRASASYLSDGQTPRLRLAIADIDVLFACRDDKGALHAPILGHSRYACERGGRLGVGGALGDVLWDPRSGRVAARWGELLAIVDLAGTSSSMAYLFGHVDLALGVAAESVWHGRDEMRTGSDHLARGVAGVRGLVRSASARWDASVSISARPALVGTVRALHDIGIVGESRLRFNTLFGSSSALSIGVLVHAGYWSDPATSSTELDSVAIRSSLFAGLVLEWRHESPRR